jgi:class 3 adenylate cyclase
VVIGGETLRAVPGLRVTALGELAIKGKQEPVDAYRLDIGLGAAP